MADGVVRAATLAVFGDHSDFMHSGRKLGFVRGCAHLFAVNTDLYAFQKGVGVHQQFALARWQLDGFFGDGFVQSDL